MPYKDMMGVHWRHVERHVLGSWTVLVLGDRGSGKTAFMALLSEALEGQGYKVTWLFPKALAMRPWPWDITTPDQLAQALSDESKWHELEHVVIVMDELWILANPRLRRKNMERVTALSRFMAVARHVDARVIMATQLAGGVDKALRLWSEAIVVKTLSLLRYNMEKDKPTWLYKLDRALLMAHKRRLSGLKPHEAVIITRKNAWLVYGIPLPKHRSEAMSRYWAKASKGGGSKET